MRILFDTNVVLDVLLGRAPHADVAAQLLALVDSGRLDGVLCATTLTTIHYLASRAGGQAEGTACVRDLLGMFDVACVDREALQSALELGFPDYEDAVLHEAVGAAAVAGIVTRNGADFAGSALPVLAPAELLAAVVAAGE